MKLGEISGSLALSLSFYFFSIEHKKIKGIISAPLAHRTRFDVRA